MTEAEVLKLCAGRGLTGHIGNIGFGDGEVWTVSGDRAFQLWPSNRQRRLERAPTQWEVDAIETRGTRTETLLHDAPYGHLPDSLPEAIKWLQGYLDKIPAKLRSKARISFDTEMEYGETYPRIVISYERPETDEEWAERRADLYERIAYHTEKRRQEYERLKATFG